MQPMVSAFWNAISEVEVPCAIFLHPHDYDKLREQWVRSPTEYLVPTSALTSAKAKALTKKHGEVYFAQGLTDIAKAGTLMLRPGVLEIYEPGGGIEVFVTKRYVPEGYFVVWGSVPSADSSVVKGILKNVEQGVFSPYCQNASTFYVTGQLRISAPVSEPSSNPVSDSEDSKDTYSNQGGLKVTDGLDLLQKQLADISAQTLHKERVKVAERYVKALEDESSLFNYRAPNPSLEWWVSPKTDWSVIRPIVGIDSEKNASSMDSSMEKSVYNEMMGLPNDPSVSQLVKHALDGMTKAAEERGFLRGIEEERKLHQEAGTLTSSAQMTWDEIQAARAADKLFVSADHCGSVPTEWLTTYRESKTANGAKTSLVEELTEKLEIANLSVAAVIEDSKEKSETYAKQVTELKGELDKARMQLAACSVVAMSNTPKSAEKNRKISPEYLSPSVQDVMNAVDREMALRTELTEAQAKIKELEAHLQKDDGVSVSPEDSTKGFGAILGVIGAVAAMAGAVGVATTPKVAQAQGAIQEEETLQEDETFFLAGRECS